jgi:type III secretory pathway lipoprotein EscJ
MLCVDPLTTRRTTISLWRAHFSTDSFSGLSYTKVEVLLEREDTNDNSQFAEQCSFSRNNAAFRGLCVFCTNSALLSVVVVAVVRLFSLVRARESEPKRTLF